MSPFALAYKILGGRIRDTTDGRNHPIVDIIKNNKRPSPTQIREHVGDVPIEPFYISDAVSYGKERHTGEPEIIHPTNTFLRDSFWKLGLGNENPDQTIAIFNHDIGELAESIGGLYAIARLIGSHYGTQQEGILLALSNGRQTILKQVKDELKEKGITQPLPRDISGVLSYLRDEAGSVEQQVGAYTELAKRVNAYIRDIGSFGWESERDKKEVKDLLHRFLGRMPALVEKPLSEPELKQHTQPLFSSLEEHASRLVPNVEIYLQNPQTILGPTCTPRSSESPLIHVLDHAIYGGERDSYMQDLLAFAIREAETGNPTAHFPVTTKQQECVDNVRVGASLGPYVLHRIYSRAMDVGKMGRLYLEVLKRRQDPRAQLVEPAWKYLMVQLPLGVIVDYAQVSVEIDRNFRGDGDQLVREFGVVRGYVGSDILREVKLQIEALKASSNQDERGIGKNLESALERLEHKLDDTPRKERGIGTTSWVSGSLERMMRGLRIF